MDNTNIFNKPKSIPVFQEVPTSSTSAYLYDTVDLNTSSNSPEANNIFNYTNDAKRLEDSFFSPEYEPGQIIPNQEKIGMKMDFSESNDKYTFFEIPTTPTNFKYDVSKEDEEYIFTDQHEINCDKIEQIQAALFSRTKFISEEIDSLEKEKIYYSITADLINKTFGKFLEKTEKMLKNKIIDKSITQASNPKEGKKIFNLYEIDLKAVFKEDVFKDDAIAKIAFKDEQYRAKQKTTPLFCSEHVAKQNDAKLNKCIDQQKKYTNYIQKYNSFQDKFKTLKSSNFDEGLKQLIEDIYQIDSMFKADYDSFKKLKRPERQQPPKPKHSLRRAIKSNNKRNHHNSNNYRQFYKTGL